MAGGGCGDEGGGSVKELQEVTECLYLSEYGPVLVRGEKKVVEALMGSLDTAEFTEESEGLKELKAALKYATLVED